MALGADLVKGWGCLRICSFLGYLTPHQPKHPHLVLFYETHVRPVNPKFFLKPPLAPKYIYFERGAHAKKGDSLLKIFQKVLKNSKFSKSFLKRSSKIKKFFENPPPRENARFAPEWPCASFLFGIDIKIKTFKV